MLGRIEYRMFALKTTHFIARATKYALGYFTLVKVYACMLDFSLKDLKVIIVNFIFMLIVATIQNLFSEMILDMQK